MEEGVIRNDGVFLDADGIKKLFQIEGKDIKTYSPLTLAFLGDAVYDLVVRTMLVEAGNRGVEGLHRDKSKYVNANAQAAIAERFPDFLTEEELEIYRWGKNAKTNSHAKNASLNAYHKATGFEALIGYLYMNGQNGRLFTVIQKAIEIVDEGTGCR